MALYGIKDSANVTLTPIGGSVPELYADYANTSTNEWQSERTYATAKGTRAISWDADKQSTLKVEMEVFGLAWLAMLAGTELKKGNKNVTKRELVKVKGAELKASLLAVPVEGSVVAVPVEDDLVTHKGEPVNPTLAGQELTFLAEGNYAVYYVTDVPDAKSFSIDSDKFPKAFKVTADALIRCKETGADEFVQITYPNARPQGNFTITMSATEATKLEVTFDLFPNAEKQMAEYVIIED